MVGIVALADQKAPSGSNGLPSATMNASYIDTSACPFVASKRECRRLNLKQPEMLPTRGNVGHLTVEREVDVAIAVSV